MDIVQQIMQQLGVTEEQAKGGAGLIFQRVKEKLGEQDFRQVAAAIPAIQGLIGAAPDGDAADGGGLLGALGGIAAKLGFDKLGSLADLAGGFEKLGLDSSMITKFIPTILEWVQKQGGDSVKGMLEKVLKA